MEKIHVTTSRDYDVIIGSDLIKDTGKYMAEVLTPCKLCLVTDDVVCHLYQNSLEDSLLAWGFEVISFQFSHGEASKSMDTVCRLLELMADNNFSRSDAIVALGGGIPGDLAGFAASIFLRGIPFIQIPTTFLAAVDSSVGGKTGVNLAAGKNLAGAFWQPSLVLCDCSTFQTLPYDVLLDGVAETIKYGAIIDQSLFALMKSLNISQNEATAKNALKQNALIDLVKRCICIKRDLVLQDERDTGMRQLLNFGHTVGHAIEKCSDYQISHGHAVALGMLIVAKASFKLKLSEENCALELEALLKKFGFPLTCAFTDIQLSEIALRDKKRSGDSITLIVPHKIGDCRLEKIPVANLRAFISAGL